MRLFCVLFFLCHYSLTLNRLLQKGTKSQILNQNGLPQLSWSYTEWKFCLFFIAEAKCINVKPHQRTNLHAHMEENNTDLLALSNTAKIMF